MSPAICQKRCENMKRLVVMCQKCLANVKKIDCHLSSVMSVSKMSKSVLTVKVIRQSYII